MGSEMCIRDRYKASNFGGLMQGNLLAASFNNKIYRVAFNQNGGLDSSDIMFSNVGTLPLDVTAQGDTEIFPGTIWAADFQGNSIVVFEPEDFGGTGPSGCVAGNSGQDADLDGYQFARDKFKTQASSEIASVSSGVENQSDWVRGEGPALVLSQTDLDFGDVLVGEQSVKSVSLTNRNPNHCLLYTSPSPRDS